MFSRRIKVEYQNGGQWRLCEVKWLDSFSMRNFTNDAIFDDTIPVSDGTMEIGARVPLEELKTSLEDWLRRKSYIGKEDQIRLTQDGAPLS